MAVNAVFFSNVNLRWASDVYHARSDLKLLLEIRKFTRLDNTSMMMALGTKTHGLDA